MGQYMFISKDRPITLTIVRQDVKRKMVPLGDNELSFMRRR